MNPALAYVLAALATALAPPEISVEIQPPNAEVGLVMTVQLSVTGEEGVDCALLELPVVDGARLSLVAGPNTQNMMMVVNGRRSSSVTTRWQLELVPERVGELLLPPFRLNCRGEETSSAAVRLLVEEGRPLDEIVTLRVTPSHEQLWVGQVVQLEVEATMRQDAWDFVPQGAADAIVLELPWLAGVPGLHPRPLQTPACNAVLMTVNRGAAQLPMCRSRDLSSGDPRDVYRGTVPLLVTEAGRIRLPDARFAVRLVVESRVQRDPFDVLQVFGRRSVVPTRVVIADAVASGPELLVRPTPLSGRPASFTNALGRFQFAGAARPSSLRVGDSCRLELVLAPAGNDAAAEGNLEYLEWPAFDLLAEDFRIFGKNERRGSGRRVLELELSPKSVAVREIPALAFSWFDPGSERYETASVGPFPLEVLPGGDGGLTTLSVPDEALSDLETIRETLPPPARRGAAPWLLSGGAALLLAALEALRWRRRREASPSARAVRRRARATLERALAEAVSVAQVSSAFARYLAAHLGGPAAGLTAEEAAERMADPELARELRRTIGGWEDSYLGGASLAVERAAGQARALAERLEAAQPSGRTETLLVLVFCASLAVLAPGPRAQDGEPAPQVSSSPFAEGVSAYRAGDYGRALEQFAGLAAHEPDDGRRAVLHGNAGTAAARAGRLGEAVWHLEGALRLRPRDRAAAGNLVRVRQRLGQTPTEARQFTTGLLRLPLLLTARETAWVVDGCLALALLLIAARRLAWMGRGALAGAVLLLLLGGSLHVAGDLVRINDLLRAVVLRPTAARGEPGAEASVLFRLDPGTVVSYEETRGEWRLVETEGGARGWVPAGEVRPAAGLQPPPAEHGR